jgi:hypothetical protein
MLKKSPSGGNDSVSPLCSRNARSQKTLVGRAQRGTHPGHTGGKVHEQAGKDYLESLAAALLGTRRISDFVELSRAARWGWAGEKSGLFEYPGCLSISST